MPKSKLIWSKKKDILKTDLETVETSNTFFGNMVKKS